MVSSTNPRPGCSREGSGFFRRNCGACCDIDDSSPPYIPGRKRWAVSHTEEKGCQIAKAPTEDDGQNTAQRNLLRSNSRPPSRMAPGWVEREPRRGHAHAEAGPRVGGQGAGRRLTHIRPTAAKTRSEHGSTSPLAIGNPNRGCRRLTEHASELIY